jgi:hypothetical protein
LLVMGAVAVLVALSIASEGDRAYRWWGPVILQLGSIVLTAGLTAWAVVRDLKKTD